RQAGRLATRGPSSAGSPLSATQRPSMRGRIRLGIRGGFFSALSAAGFVAVLVALGVACALGWSKTPRRSAPSTFDESQPESAAQATSQPTRYPASHPARLTLSPPRRDGRRRDASRS